MWPPLVYSVLQRLEILFHKNGHWDKTESTILPGPVGSLDASNDLLVLQALWDCNSFRLRLESTNLEDSAEARNVRLGFASVSPSSSRVIGLWERMALNTCRLLTADVKYFGLI